MAATLTIPAPQARFSLARRLAFNTVWSVIGSIAAQGSSLVGTVILGRMLGVTTFGKLSLLLTTVLTVQTLAELGLGLTTTKVVASLRNTDAARAGRTIGFALRSAALSGFVFAVALAFSIHRMPALRMAGAALVFAPVLLLSELLNRVQMSALAGLESFQFSARAQLCRCILTPLMVWIGARNGGLTGALVGLGCASLIVCAATYQILRLRCADLNIPIRYRGFAESAMLRTSVCLWGSALLLNGSAWLAGVLLASQPGGLTELGLFNASEKWRAALVFLPNMLFQVTLPMLSHANACVDRRSCSRILGSALGLSMATTGVLAAIVVFQPALLMSIFGTGFSRGADVLSLAAWGSVAAAVWTVGSGALWAIGNPLQMLLLDALRAGLFLALCVGLPHLAARDLARASLVSFVVGGIVIFAILWRRLASGSTRIETANADSL